MAKDKVWCCDGCDSETFRLREDGEVLCAKCDSPSIGVAWTRDMGKLGSNKDFDFGELTVTPAVVWAYRD